MMGREPLDTLIAWIQCIPEYERPHALNSVLIGICSCWWDAHQDSYRKCESIEASMQELFQLDVNIHQYTCPYERHSIVKQRCNVCGHYMNEHHRIPKKHPIYLIPQFYVGNIGEIQYPTMIYSFNTYSPTPLSLQMTLAHLSKKWLSN
jgi:hypothetical protein